MRKGNAITIAISVVAVLIAAALFLYSGWLQGWDFAAAFTSQQAILAYVIVGLWAIAVAMILIKDKLG